MSKTVRCFIAMLFTVCSIPFTSLAQGKDNTIFYGENTAVGSIVSFRDRLYILRYEGLFVYDEDTKVENLITDTVSGYWNSDVYIDTLLSDSSGLYGYHTGKMSLLRILDKNATLVGEKVLQLEGVNSPNAIMLQDGALYLLEKNNNEQTLHKISITDCQESAMTIIMNTFALTAYKDGYALAIQSERLNGQTVNSLSKLNLSDGSAEEIAQLDTSIKAVVYDKATDSIYLAGYSKMYKWNELEGISVSAHTIGGDTGAATVFGKDMAAVIVDNSIAVRNLGKAAQQSVLVLLQPYGRGENYQAFLTVHPEISLLFEGDYFKSSEERFIEDMITGSDNIDIYMLSDINLLATIYSKEYGVDMSGDETLNAAVKDMYPPFQNLFLQNNAVYAIPQSIYIATMGYDSGFFEGFGLDTPNNYSELLDLAQLWLEVYADEHPEAYFDPFSNGVELIRLLERYADECTGNRQEIIYERPDMVDILERYLKISSAYKESRIYGSYDMHAFNVIDVPHIGQFTYLPLSVRKGNKPVISGSDMELKYFVVNPHSKHQEEAFEFLSSTVIAWPDMTKVVLLKSAAHPVERGAFTAEKADILSRLSDLQASLSESNAIDLPAIQQKIDEEELALAFCENVRWDVAQDEIDWYQSVVDSIVVSSLNPLTVLQDSQANIFSQLQGGNLDAKRFLKLLDERVRLLNSEGY